MLSNEAFYYLLAIQKNQNISAKLEVNLLKYPEFWTTYLGSKAATNRRILRSQCQRMTSNKNANGSFRSYWKLFFFSWGRDDWFSKPGCQWVTWFLMNVALFVARHNLQAERLLLTSFFAFNYKIAAIFWLSIPNVPAGSDFQSFYGAHGSCVRCQLRSSVTLHPNVK